MKKLTKIWKRTSGDMTTHILSMTYQPKIEPKEIDIPFRFRFDKVLEEGIKVRTWRTRRYGRPRDWFMRHGRRFVLTKIERAAMGSVPAYYIEEGFNSEEDAINELKEIFATNGYEPNRMGWAHWFKLDSGHKVVR